MSTAIAQTANTRHSLGYHLGTVALWTGLLSFIGIFFVIFIPTC